LWGDTLHAQDEGQHEIDDPSYYVSKLFLQLAKFIEFTFNGLNTMKDWQHFYAHLVRRLVLDFNRQQDSEEQKINADEIRMPAINEDTKETTDVVALTRLLYQAMVTIRVAVADGQHRILATLLVLQGHHVCNSLSRSPPFYFEFLPDIGLGYGIQTYGEALQGRCSVRFVYHVTLNSLDIHMRNFEKLGEAYSRIRDTSQASKRQRTLCDM
jgi:hypothetical protein